MADRIGSRLLLAPVGGDALVTRTKSSTDGFHFMIAAFVLASAGLLRLQKTETSEGPGR